MKYPYSILVFILLVAGMLACSTVSKQSKSKATDNVTDNAPKELFALANGGSVTSDEFEYAYQKNNINNTDANTKKDIEEYLDLYITFKQKVQAAKDLGMDTTSSFLSEFNSYKESLLQSYLQSKDLTDKLIQEAYDRYKEEVSAAHILIRLYDQSDTISAYHKIDSIRQLALQGQDFNQLAMTYSEDPTATTNGGELGYFTSMRMVYPFESAAYNTKVGDISEILRTQFGYHILKVNDRRASQGKVKVAHIMVRTSANDSQEAKDAAKNKIFNIHDQLNNGVPWDQLCSKFSEDLNTHKKGGKLPEFGTGQMPTHFSQAAFDLQEVGQYADPITTPYGWHIIKLEGKQPIESYEEMVPRIRNHISRDERVALNKKAIVTKLKNENNFQKVANHQRYLLRLDSTLLSATWEYKEQPTDTATVFTIGNDDYTEKDFYHYVTKHQNPVVNRKLIDYTKQLYDQFEEHSLINYEKEHLAEKNIEYKMLIREYWEGIMLFNLMNEKVWDKALKDTLGLVSFFEKNKNKYQWQRRAKSTIYDAENAEIIDKIIAFYEANDTTQLVKDKLITRFNTQSELSLVIKEGNFEKKDEEILSQVEWKIGMQQVMLDGRYYLVVIQNLLPQQHKSLKECKGEVIADYQKTLENQWIKKLSAKYPASVDESAFAKTLKKLEK